MYYTDELEELKKEAQNIIKQVEELEAIHIKHDIESSEYGKTYIEKHKSTFEAAFEIIEKQQEIIEKLRKK